MNLQARLYDPVIGRFLSVDPLAEIQLGITPYHYCGNDPVNMSDASGLSPSGWESTDRRDFLDQVHSFQGYNSNMKSCKSWNNVYDPWDIRLYYFVGADGNGLNMVYIPPEEFVPTTGIQTSPRGTTAIRVLVSIGDEGEVEEKTITVNGTYINASTFVMTQEAYGKLNVSGTTYSDLEANGDGQNGCYEVPANLIRFLEDFDKPDLYKPNCETPAVYLNGRGHKGDMNRVKENEQPNCSESMRKLFKNYPAVQYAIHTHPNNRSGGYQSLPSGPGWNNNGQYVDHDYSIFHNAQCGIVMTSQTICFYNSKVEYIKIRKSYLLRSI